MNQNFSDILSDNHLSRNQLDALYLAELHTKESEYEIAHHIKATQICAAIVYDQDSRYTEELKTYALSALCRKARIEEHIQVKSNALRAICSLSLITDSFSQYCNQTIEQRDLHPDIKIQMLKILNNENLQIVQDAPKFVVETVPLEESS